MVLQNHVLIFNLIEFACLFFRAGNKKLKEIKARSINFDLLKSDYASRDTLVSACIFSET